jgi:hypothetical protein
MMYSRCCASAAQLCPGLQDRDGVLGAELLEPVGRQQSVGLSAARAQASANHRTPPPNDCEAPHASRAAFASWTAGHERLTCEAHFTTSNTSDKYPHNHAIEPPVLCLNPTTLAISGEGRRCPLRGRTWPTDVARSCSSSRLLRTDVRDAGAAITQRRTSY